MREGGRERGREEGREGGRERGRVEGREGGRERGREEGREGGRRSDFCVSDILHKPVQDKAVEINFQISDSI